MGEWSDYFDDFPDENPANHVNGRFDPEAAKELRAAKVKLGKDQSLLSAEIRAIIQRHRRPAPGKK